MSRYDVMKSFSAGFVAALTPLPVDDSQNEHWQAGYLAGYKARATKNAALNEYLISTGREPQATICLASGET